MSPAKFHEDDHARRMIHGPRPSPLRINKDSNPIHKSSSSSIPALIPPQRQQNPTTAVQHQRKPPVIIYTHSPKIIHTQARDFMALVQKLTGLSPSDHDEAEEHHDKDNHTKHVGDDDDDDDNNEKYAETTTTTTSNYPYLADMPLFTPNSNDFFCSPRPLFRYSNMVSSSPNMANLMSSPSFLEVMKGLPEY